jgi:polygalacturonase
MKKSLQVRFPIFLLVIGFIFSGMGFTTRAQVSSVKDFGAKGDGITDDTKAIQEAIDNCASKGWKVFFPEGTFMTGTVYLRSNTTLELTVKAIWKGIGRTDAYPVQRPVGLSGKPLGARGAMIFAEGVENICLCGQGLFYGNGEHEAFRSGIADSPERPYGIWIVRGRNIKIEGIRMQNSAYWMQNYQECDHLRITGINVFNHVNLNNDGLDITDCHNVIVSDCEIDSSDDALVPKSHSERCVSDLLVSNCILASHAHCFKLGTASVGGFRHITVNNLVLRTSLADHITHQAKVKGGESGIELLSSDGGILEDITIRNVVMDGQETPFCIKLGDRWAKQQGDLTGKTAGIIRNILIGDVIVRNAGPIPGSITGYPGHKVENITLSNMLIEIDGGLPAYDEPVPENSGNYPYNRIFGPKLPAYAFFVRHAQNVRFQNIQVRTIAADERRAFLFDDATGVLENVDILNEGGDYRGSVLVDRTGAIELRGSTNKLKVDTGSK